MYVHTTKEVLKYCGKDVELVRSKRSPVLFCVESGNPTSNVTQQQQIQETQSHRFLPIISTMARALFIFALIIAAASAFVQPANVAGESLRGGFVP